MLRKSLWVLLGTGVLAFLTRGIVLEDDPIRSLADPDPTRAALFERYQERSPFRDKVFVEMGELAPAERERVEGLLAEARYEEVALFRSPSPADALALAALLPVEDVRRLMQEDALRARAEEALGMAMLPGGDAYLRALEADPLGIGPALLARLGHGQAGGPVRVFRSPRPLDYDAVERVQEALAALTPRVHFIGADFFSLENYRAVKHDILVCSVLSGVLPLAVFFAFAGRWLLLALLLAGSAVSYLAGLLAVRAFYGQIYAVVLAYTSTFVGFNNESLVHLAGVDLERRGRSLLGIWSAIGTTFIGFLILLLGRSVMVRQMALASLGGMVGFLAFLVPYRSVLRGATFRGIRWPMLTVRPAAVAAACALAAVGALAVGVPRIATRIEAFRYQTPALEAQVAHFTRRLDALSMADVVAIPAPGTPGDALAPLAAAGFLDPARHPLAAWRAPDDQARTVRALREGYPGAAARLSALLLERGVRLEPPVSLPASVAERSAWDYLERLGALGPVRWTDEVGGKRYVMAGLLPAGSSRALPPGVVPVSPQRYYDGLLTGFSRELGWLFLGGLAAMALYLAYLQRSAARVLYVFAPLFLSALAFAAYARVTGSTLHIVHIMGFSLVIALAIDYTAVGVSADHHEVEMTKVLLTGLCTLASFGVLVLARHPVLRDLGATVALGCGISLAFALFVRLPRSSEGQS
ncbi:MAG TPA: hypothetical protein VFP65_22980 [Anaeromyxobacteraceae bacterium]|nr:hypothetical protein [Anaeromyxobacteraceae bacterium]